MTYGTVPENLPHFPQTRRLPPRSGSVRMMMILVIGLTQDVSRVPGHRTDLSGHRGALLPIPVQLLSGNTSSGGGPREVGSVGLLRGHVVLRTARGGPWAGPPLRL